jgi:5-methylcytosine-specific restriction endonuclease McrA
MGNPLAHSSVRSVEALPRFDEELQRRYIAEWQAERERQRHARTGEWWDQYRAYMESPEWHKKRYMALERDQFLCQGCRTQRATEVHHFHYKRLGRELLFDLVSLCGACHEIAHEDEESD